jgi:beta-lactam-binding protein with PASTA domain
MRANKIEKHVQTKKSAIRLPATLAVLLLAAICPIAPTAAQLPAPVGTKWRLTDLGVLSGTNGGNESNALAINASGQVAGVSGSNYVLADLLNLGSYGFYTGDAFSWKNISSSPNGLLSYLGAPAGATCLVPASTVGGITSPAGVLNLPTSIGGINSSGQIAGTSWNNTNGLCSDGYQQAVLFPPAGTVQYLGPPPGYAGPAYYSFATGINNAGQIIGYVTPANENLYKVWLMDAQGFHILGALPGATVTTPNAINNNGMIVGGSGNLGFVHIGTGPIQATDAINPFGGPSSAAFGVNDAGMVVGVFQTPGTYLATHGFLIDLLGRAHDLGTLSSSSLANSSANAISNLTNADFPNSATIVGSSDVDPNATWISTRHAVIWESTANILDLNSVLDASVSPPLDAFPQAVINGQSPPTGTGVPCPKSAGCWELISANAINDKGQIVGEANVVPFNQTTGQLRAFLLNPPCMNEGGDTDGDGLCDNWEQKGYTASDGTFVDLPAMGASPYHKDVFVHVDYMVAASHTHKPKLPAMKGLIQIFADAPVQNPDDNTGIALHIDCGPDCIMNEYGDTWGSTGNTASHALQIPEVTPFLAVAANGTLDFTALDNTRMQDTYYTNYRSPIFHYVLFAHTLTAASLLPGMTITGASEGRPTSSSVVSLGGITRDNRGTLLQQAGTFMHELGHNFGLGHGGLDDVNFKPNYLSIMNYSFQSIGLIQGGTANYTNYSSFSAVPPLNETALNEMVGLNDPTELARYGTVWFCPPGKTLGGKSIPYTLNADGPIDWNCNGTTESNVTAYVDGSSNCSIIGPLAVAECYTLNSFEDWSHLIYTGGSIGARGVALPALPIVYPFETPLPALSSPYQIQVEGPDIAQATPGANLNLSFTLTNTGDLPDTYNLTFSTDYNWYTSSNIPSTLTLASGQSQQFIVPISVPANFGCTSVAGIEAQFELDAVSQTASVVNDSGFAEIDLSPMAGSAIVPAVFGLSQTAAETAILNAGLAVTLLSQYDAIAPVGTVIGLSPNQCTSLPIGSAVTLTVSLGPDYITIPNLVGTSETAASSAITSLGLTVGTISPAMSSTVPEFDVISQNPAAGTLALAGATVSFVFSEGSQTLAQTPDLSSQTVAAATAAGFTLGTFTPALSSSVATFSLISQDPPAGTFAPIGTPINLVYSAGSNLIPVPDVVGQWQGTAANLLLADLQFKVAVTRQPSTTVPDGYVLSQSPAASTPALLTSAVNLVVSSGSAVMGTVPNLVVDPSQYGNVFGNGTLQNAGKLIYSAGFTVGTVIPQVNPAVPEGYVIAQSPAAGATARWDTSINLIVSGSHVINVPVPNLVGLTESAAISTLNQSLDASPLAGDYFTYTYTTQPSTSVPAGIVISQNPTPGITPLPIYGNEEFAPIHLVISGGPNPVPEYAFSGLLAGFGRVVAATISGNEPILQGTAIGKGQVSPLGIAIDPFTHNFIVGDSTSGTIQIFASNGQFKGYFGGEGLLIQHYDQFQTNDVTFFPGKGNGNGLLAGPPAGIAVDPVTENIAVVDYLGSRVLLFNFAGQLQTVFGSQGSGPGQFNFVDPGASIAIDPVTENILVTDGGNSRVQVFNSAGVYQSQFGSSGTASGQFGEPLGIAIDPTSRNIMVADLGLDRVSIFNSAGVFLSQFGSAGQADGQFLQPGALAIDPVNHNIIVTDRGLGNQNDNLPLNRVQIFDSTGNFLSKFGGASGSSAGAFAYGFAGNQGLVVDPVTRDIIIGNSDSIESFSLQGTSATTSTVIISSANPATLNQSVTFTATVTGHNPTGSVQFMDGSNALLLPVALSGGSASVSLSSLTAGSHAVTAVYGGDTANSASTSAGLIEIVNLSGTTTALTSSLNPATKGQSVNFTATVTGNSPTGTVQFMDGTTSLQSPVPLTAGTASLTLATLSVGAHSITSVYSGDSANSGSSSVALNEVINRANTSTTIASSPNAARTGQSVTFSAAVTGLNPTGTVQFLDGSSALVSPVTLNSGAASITVSTLSTGTHSITAAYSGDSSNAPSSSAILSEVISAPTLVVTPPASISVPATQASGATSAASSALAAFLAAGSVTSSLATPPTRLAPQISGVAINSATVFPTGTTLVTFSYEDSAGNIASATSSVTVAVGAPRITGSTAGIGSDPSGAIFVNLVLTNTGTGNARNLILNALTFRTLSGTGTVTYNATLSPTLPLTIGALDVGTATTYKVYLNVPSTVSRISVTASGPVQDVLGTNYNYSTAVALVP